MVKAKHILVVDDDEDLLFMLGQLLHINGFSVQMLSRGEELFQKMLEKLPDLILLDINLSGCDGRDLCLSVKDRVLYADIPIILYSAGNYSLDVCGQYKADIFIAKPFDTLHMVASINTLCNQ